MRITSFALIAVTAAALAGCSSTDSGDGGRSPSTFYACENGARLKVDYSAPDSVSVQVDDEAPILIPADPAASGAKYMSPTHQFWSKGEEAIWTVGRMVPTTCKQVMMPGAM